ncbi:hypothetical protein MNEG_8907 [Monoraphidium neglectum]|uniref:Major facilitator superfamily (MFS) profile domain-containing protein n=1 Tax=Monoraphidium neglectum TaxID=145388 RepID=A0A0D2ME98_9CHLO|nr:hypothetical protein MNEG_8907 [Monoraphidium neglectum]KIY99056.1 hypothetical protein MNEG_8907 [Monoraphidium neglectum]|eukprot:XP_013898076.1 hypothetical protein MNEG_8907 [Monoraphidium neglectum]
MGARPLSSAHASGAGQRPWSVFRRLAPRYQIVVACFLATFVAYVERVGFSIAFTEIAKSAGAGEALKGAVLSAFYWGYGVSQIPGGWAAQIYGGRIMLVISFALWSIASVLTPGSLAGGTRGVVAARVCVGVAQGLLIPAVHTVLSQPSPPAPARPTSVARKGRTAPTPWRRMLRSPAVWAIVANNFAFHYAFYVVMNWMPTYFSAVLKRDLSDLGPIKALPYLAMFLTSNAGGWAGDWLINRRGLSVATARKAVNTAGMLASAAALVVMPSAQGVWGGVLLSTATLGALGFSRGGFSVNHMDIAPKYAGIVMGLSNTAGAWQGQEASNAAGSCEFLRKTKL